jgi:PAS domain S-box-containing protein
MMDSKDRVQELEQKLAELEAQNEQLRSVLRKNQNAEVDRAHEIPSESHPSLHSENAHHVKLEELSRAQAVAHTGSWRLDVRRNILLWSDENHRIFGIPKGRPLTYETFLSTVHPDDRDYVDRNWAAALRGEPYDIKHRIVVGGAVKWVRERAELEFDRNGQLLGGFGTTQDISDLKKAEEQLEQSKEQFRAMGEAVDYGVWLCNKAGKVEYISQSYLDLLGQTMDEVKGNDCVKHMVRSDHDGSIKKNWMSCLQIGGTWDVEHRVVDGNGGVHYILTRGKPVRDREGIITSWAGINLDITARKLAETALRRANDMLEEKVRQRTAKLEGAVRALENEMEERKQAEDQLRMLSRVFMDAADPIIIEDLTGTIVEMNREAERAYGWNRNELIGKSSRSIIPQERYACAGELRQRCRDGREVRNWEGKREDKFGRVFPVLTSAFPLMNENGEIIGIATISKDVSLLKKMQAELRASHIRLRELSRKTILALEADRRTVSKELHDSIGGSLAAIKFTLEALLEDRDFAIDPDDGEKVLKSVVSHLVDTIKETKRISVNLRPMTLDDLGLIATVNWYTRSFGEIYTNIRTQTEIELQEKDVPDPLKIVIYRVMQEALTNAAKHSNTNMIRISLRKVGKNIELEVEDQGCGFDVEQVSNSENSLSGYGLEGMRERAEICGGSFSLVSNPQKGTRIKVNLPLEGF